MASLRRWWLRILHAVRPASGDAEMAREVASHVALIEAALRDQGLPPDQAHREARRRIGGLARMQDLHRDARSAPWLDHLRLDLRDACRSIARHPRTTAIALIILAGTGTINALLLGIADGVLLRPLPYRNPDELFVMMMQSEPSGQRFTMIPGPVIGLFKEDQPELSRAGLIDSLARIRQEATPDDARPLVIYGTTAAYLDVLGVRPTRGRWFTAGDSEGRSAVITHEVWMTRFGGTETTIGQTLTAGGRTFDVIGILPPRIFFPTLGGSKPDVLVLAGFPDPTASAREGAAYPVFRLPSGVRLEQAQAKIAALTRDALPPTPQGRSVPTLIPVADVLFPTGRPIMQLLFAGATILVVIACVNLGGLLLIRGRRRAQDIGVKLALGARTSQLIRPVLFEIAIVALGSGVVAVIASRLAFESLLRQVPRVAYGNAPVGIDLRVGLIAVGCGLAGAILFAFLPVWRATRRDVQANLRGGAARAATSRWTLGRPLVAIQVALSVVLVFGAVVTGKAFIQVLSVPLGFDPDRVVMFTLPLPPGADRREFTSTALARVRQHPAVAAAGAAGHVPFDGATPDDGVEASGDKTMLAGISYVMPGLPEALGIPLIRGRLLAAEDARTDVDAALVSQAAAQALYGDADPIGRTFQSASGRTLHVVGVVGDVRDALSRDSPPATYVIPTAGRRPLRIVLRLRDRNDVVAHDLMVQLGLPKGRSEASIWFDDQISNVTEYRNPRFQTTVLLVMGGAALLLTVCGIVGVVGFQVASRTRELGIRMVIGARPAELAAFVLRQSTWPVVFGLAAGLAGTYWVGKLAEAQLFRVEGADPAAFGVTGLIVLLSAITAAWLPARRAGRVDPVIALRAE